MSALQNHDYIKQPEYYCLIHRYNGTPLLNALKNPTDNLSETFDVFYGPYYGDDGIRPQLTELSEKKGGKSFKDRKKLTEYFAAHFGANTEIRIFDAMRGEIMIEGGNGAHESSGEITKPSINRFPLIHLNSANKASENKTPVLDSYNLAFADNIEHTARNINPAFNRVPPINLQSSIKPVQPSKWHTLNNGRGAELLDVHGMFGTKIATSRRLATIVTSKGTAQTTPAKPEKREKKWF